MLSIPFLNYSSIPSHSIPNVYTPGVGLISNKLLIFFGVLLFLTVAFAYYYFYLKPSSQATYRANAEANDSESGSPDSSTNEAELLLFYANWCPHCKTAKPIWEEVRTQYEKQTINGYKVIFTEINCTDDDNQQVTKLMDKYNVEGFPTIKLLKDGEIIEYDAKPNKENLNQFLNTVLK
jgi:thiol-disulfide isomerase/thioredoxin